MSEQDTVAVHGITATGHHGVLPEERRDGQRFVADVVMSFDTAPAAASGDLAATVDYASVAADVVAIIEGDPVDLVETLAQRIADRVLTRDLVRSVEVTVHKPEAPVGVPFGDVVVRITRTRSA